MKMNHTDGIKCTYREYGLFLCGNSCTIPHKFGLDFSAVNLFILHGNNSFPSF